MKRAKVTDPAAVTSADPRAVAEPKAPAEHRGAARGGGDSSAAEELQSLRPSRVHRCLDRIRSSRRDPHPLPL